MHQLDMDPITQKVQETFQKIMSDAIMNKKNTQLIFAM